VARRRVGLKARAATPGIEKHAAGAQAEELLKERARLLREVQKKQSQVAQVKERAAKLADEAVARMAPVVERQARLAARLDGLFRELLSEGRLVPRARREVLRLRRLFELEGLLEPTPGVDDEDDTLPADEEPREAWEAPPRHASRRQPAGRGRPEVAGAAQVGQERRSLRDIFRNLARAVHPDQARQEDERQRRTEVMKQVTRAYEDGDLARLVELESTWQSEQALREGGDPELRCRELLRLNRELLNQLREVTRQLRDAKYELNAAAESFAPPELVDLAMSELDDVEAICELLVRFRDGKISVQDLVHGPEPRPRRKRSARA
jgi:hypothetical protein